VLDAWFATVARNAGCEAYRIGGVEDHVHLAICLSRTLAIADLVEMLKTSSSKWIKTQSAALGGIAWQRSCGCCSAGPADLDSLCETIAENGIGWSAKDVQGRERKKFGE
jgi:REP element-mobilizing transposase RayT